MVWSAVCLFLLFSNFPQEGRSRRRQGHRRRCREGQGLRRRAAAQQERLN